MIDFKSRQLGLQGPLQYQQEDLAKLNQASLEMMETVGMRFFDDEALELFKNGGATVEDNNLVKIKPDLVEWALGCVPKTIMIYDRDGNQAMELGENSCYYGVGSDCAYCYDLDSGERRKAKIQDVIDGIRLVDALAHVDFAMSLVLPSDVPLGQHEFYQMEVMMQETTKPIVFVGESLQSTQCAIEMATAVVGSVENLSSKPFIINYVNTISSINHNGESVKRLLHAAERNIPTIYGPAHTRGTIGPMTTAGSVVFGNAGHLAGLVLSQLKREGSPFLRTVPGNESVDMRSMVDLYAPPDDGLMGWDLARDQQLPIFGYGGCSDAKAFDAQAAAEASLTLFANTINGANLIHDMGYLDCAMTYSFELLMLCDEIVSWLKRYFSPSSINKESIGMDFMHELGTGINPLASKHTFQHVRSGWQPKLFDRNNQDRWEKNGNLNFDQRAREQAKQLIAERSKIESSATIRKNLSKIRTRYVKT